eukprot:scaffold145924_cov13-Tisochrysis_lutea.AAC.1
MLLLAAHSLDLLAMSMGCYDRISGLSDQVGGARTSLHLKSTAEEKQNPCMKTTLFSQLEKDDPVFVLFLGLNRRMVGKACT